MLVTRTFDIFVVIVLRMQSVTNLTVVYLTIMFNCRTTNTCLCNIIQRHEYVKFTNCIILWSLTRILFAAYF